MENDIIKELKNDKKNKMRLPSRLNELEGKIRSIIENIHKKEKASNKSLKDLLKQASIYELYRIREPMDYKLKQNINEFVSSFKQTIYCCPDIQIFM